MFVVCLGILEEPLRGSRMGRGSCSLSSGTTNEGWTTRDSELLELASTVPWVEHVVT